MFRSHRLSAIAFTIIATAFTRAETPPGNLDAPVRKLLEEVFTRTGPRVGQQAPDFRLHRLGGGVVEGSALWAKKPVLLTTGSYTCPIFRDSTAGRRTLREKYGDRIEFVIIYVREAHPADAPSPYTPPGGKGFLGTRNQRDGISLNTSQTYEERIAKARTCQDALDIKSIVAVDTLDNPAWAAYGGSPNAGFLIGKGGTVLLQQGLFDATAMEAAIKKLLGEK